MIDTKTLAAEIRRRNPKLTLDEIARACGVTKQAIHLALKGVGRQTNMRRYVPTYEDEVAYVEKVIRSRGRIWEGARPAYEAGTYPVDAHLDRMLREGVIVPSPDPNGGYILPPTP